MDWGVRKVVSLTGVMPGFPYIQVSVSPQSGPRYQSPAVHKKKLRLREIRALARGDTHSEQGPGFQPVLLYSRARALSSHAPPG